MIIDAFPAFKEIELARFRIHYLSNLVDLTVIAEARLTQSGLEKPLYFKEWLAEQSDELRTKVRIIEVPLLSTSTSWEREIYTREYLFNYIKMNFLAEKFILSDLDEIPSRGQVEKLITSSGIFHFHTPTFYRKINWKLSDLHANWSHGVMGEVGLNIYPNGGRFSREIPRLIAAPGAHFSWLGIEKQSLWEKSKAAAHAELNETYWASEVLLQYCDKYRVDHLGRGRNLGWGIFNIIDLNNDEITGKAYEFFPNWADTGIDIPRFASRFWASMKITSYVAQTRLANYARKKFEPGKYFGAANLTVSLIVSTEIILSLLHHFKNILRGWIRKLWKIRIGICG